VFKLQYQDELCRIGTIGPIFASAWLSVPQSKQMLILRERFDERLRGSDPLGILVIGLDGGRSPSMTDAIRSDLVSVFKSGSDRPGPTAAVVEAKGFIAAFLRSLFAGIFLVAPYIVYQVWAFIAPGLYAHERGYAVPFILFGSLFFLLGGLFGHYILFPLTFQFLIQVGDVDIKFLPRITEYFSFYSWFLLGLGLVFQLPVLIFVLSRIGLVTAGFLARQFKYALLAAFVVSAVITPGGDMVSQTVLAVPLIGLYTIGIVVAWLFGKPRQEPVAATAEGEAKATG